MFKLIEKKYIKDLKTEGTLYEHECGMRVFHIEAEDEELFFSFAFPTPPASSDGVFHIIEHSALSGSKDYPVRDPFTSLSASSVASYMNAMTFPDMTLYLAASPLKKDFDNLFAVYADAVFAPLLRKETFMQEGIRRSEEGFDGVVFNEMRGDSFSRESVSATASLRGLFESGPYSYDSGGEPREIAKLTYEQFLSVWKEFYHPSNCYLFTYGKGVDIEEKLTYLDKKYLKDVKRKEITEMPQAIKFWEKPKTEIKYYAANSDEASSAMMLSFLTNRLSTSAYDVMFVNILVDILLGGPSCPLYKAALECPYASDLSGESGMSADFFQLTFACGLTGVKKEDEEKSAEYMLGALKTIAEEGIDKDIIESSLRRQEFLLEEIPGGMPNGLRLTLKCVRPALRSLSPFDAFASRDSLARLREELKNEPKLFENFIKEELLSSPHRLTLFVRGSNTLLKEEDDKLEEIAKTQRPDKAALSAFNAFIKGNDSQFEYTIPRLEAEDVPLSVSVIGQEEMGQIIYEGHPTGRVVYVDLAIDVSDLDNEELKYVSFLSRLLMITGLKGEKSEKIHRAMRLVTGGASAYIESGKVINGGVRAFFVFRMKVFPERLAESFKLLSDLLKQADVEDEAMLVATREDMLSDFEENCEYQGTAFVSSVATSSLTPSYTLGEEVMGIKAWKYFASLDIEEAKVKVASAYKHLSESCRFILHLTGEEEDKSMVVKEGEKFLSYFEKGHKASDLERARGGEKRLLYTLQSPVAYNAVAFKASPFCTKEGEAENVFSLMLSSGELYRQIRMEGGAYGANASYDPTEESFVLSSYRDPHLASTFVRFKSALENATIDEESLKMAKLQALGKTLRPLSPAAKGLVSLRRICYNITDEMRKERRALLAEVELKDVEQARARLLSQFIAAPYASIAPSVLYEKEKIDLYISALPIKA